MVGQDTRKGQHQHLVGAGFFEGARGRVDGRAGGQHIIDQKDIAAVCGDALLVRHPEHAAYIGLPLGRGQPTCGLVRRARMSAAEAIGRPVIVANARASSADWL